MVKTLAAFVLALVGLGYLGALHPIGDSFAVFRLPLIVGAGLLGLVLRPRRLAVTWVCLLLALAAHHLWQGRPAQMAGAGAVPDFVLYQQNLLWNRGTLGAGWQAALDQAQPDALTLQEVSEGNRPILAALAVDYPTQVVCPFGKIGAPAVLSRWPAVPGTQTCVHEHRMAAVQLDHPDGPVWVVSLHLRWPWPDGQGDQVRALVPVLQGLSGDVVIGGDFNAVAWSDTLRRVARAARAQRLGPYSTTFHIPPVMYPLGIDHVLSPWRAVELRVMPKFASDHHGVLARLQRAAGD